MRRCQTASPRVIKKARDNARIPPQGSWPRCRAFPFPYKNPSGWATPLTPVRKHAESATFNRRSKPGLR
jgi:hypothetical protein